MQGQQRPTSATKASYSGDHSAWSCEIYLHISGPQFPQLLRKGEAGESSETHWAHLAVVRKNSMRSSTYKVFRAVKHACSTQDSMCMDDPCMGHELSASPQFLDPQRPPAGSTSLIWTTCHQVTT